VTVPAEEEWLIDYDVGNFLNVYGTANLLTGASVSLSIYVQTNGTLNMESGTVGLFISVSSDAAGVTIYGTDFEIDDVLVGYGLAKIPDNTLTGTYGDGSSINLWIMSGIDINLQPPQSGGPVEVQIDIKPGSDPPNPINPGSNGLIPVAILTTETFDAAWVDPSTVTLAGQDVAVRGKAEKLMERLEDVDADGDLDLLVQVETQSDDSVDALWESGFVTLTGNLFDEFESTPIEGEDEIIIVPPSE
jgi:hypothetical protein